MSARSLALTLSLTSLTGLACEPAKAPPEATKPAVKASAMAATEQPPPPKSTAQPKAEQGLQPANTEQPVNAEKPAKAEKPGKQEQPANSKQPARKAKSPMKLEVIPEMEALPGAWSKIAPEHAQTQACDALMAKAWPGMSRDLATQLGHQQLLSMSKWAKEQMSSYRPAKGWLDKLAPKALFHVGRSRTLVYGPSAGSAAELPSHSELVKRRLFVFVECRQDGDAAELGAIYVTIRGQLEE